MRARSPSCAERRCGWSKPRQWPSLHAPGLHTRRLCPLLQWPMQLADRAPGRPCTWQQLAPSALVRVATQAAASEPRHSGSARLISGSSSAAASSSELTPCLVSSGQNSAGAAGAASGSAPRVACAAAARLLTRSPIIAPGPLLRTYHQTLASPLAWPALGARTPLRPCCRRAGRLWRRRRAAASLPQA